MKKLNIIIICIFIYSCICSQNASLVDAEKLIDIPVDHFTGVSAYSVPIGTVSDGSLSVPVSITYSSSGLRPSELTVPMGQGWILNSGFSLSKQIVGLPDEATTGTFFGYPANQGCTSGNCINSVRDQIAAGTMDGQPDIFTYTIGGYTGKFIINTSQQIEHITLSDVKVIRNEGLSMMAHPFETFKFITPDGISYKFIASERTNLLAIFFGSPNVIHSWVVDKIISYDNKDSISFEYETSHYGKIELVNDTTVFPSLPIDNVTILNNNYLLLTRITGNHSEMVFNTETSGVHQNTNVGIYPKRYNSINFYQGNICISFSFQYADLFNGSSKTGIRLTQLLKQNCIEPFVAENPYLFEYFEDLGSNFHPSPGTRAIDHWGFYNNTMNTTLLPSTCNGMTCIGNANREADLLGSRSGVLKKVTNSNLLETNFTYELNTVEQSWVQRDTLADIEYCSPYGGSTTPGTCQGYNTVISGPFNLTVDNISGAKLNICMKPDTLNIGNNLGAYDIFVRIKNTSNVILHTISLNPSNVDEFCSTFNFEDIVDSGGTPIMSEGNQYILEMSTLNCKGKTIATTWSTNLGQVDVGGLRLTQIKHSDGNTANDITTNYSYENGVLYRQPTYIYFLPGAALVNNFGFSSLVGANGYHIGYKKVTKSGNTPGKTILDYRVIPITVYDQFIIPSQLKLGMGDLISTTIYDDNDVEIVKDSFSYLYTLGSSPSGIAGFSSGSVKGTFDYQIATGIARPSQSFSYYLGALTKSSSIGYDYSQTLMPSTSISLTATGQETGRFYQYTPDTWFGTEINNYFTNKNIITPFVDVQLEQGVDVRGAITEYAGYSNAGAFIGGAGLSDPTAIVRPSKIQDYKYNPLGTSSVIATGWQDEKTFHSYNSDGLVNQDQIIQWPVQDYTYSEKRNTKHKYLNHEKRFIYKTNSNLVDTVYNIDGTAVVHTFDGLIRLQSKKYIPSGIETVYTYHFSTGMGDFSYVKETTTYPFSDIRSAISSLEKIIYFDRYGREIETVFVKASPDTFKDVIVACTYDQYNRKTRNYLPIESAFNDGRFVSIDLNWKYTSTEYEDSPLSRVIATTPADWFTSYLTYGLNTLSDGVVGFNAHQLLKQIATDANGDISVVFTDFKGRKVLDRRTNATDDPSSRLDTYYEYDIKDRLIKVIPPGATHDSTDLIYVYAYDAEDKLLAKKVPQADTINQVYNLRDQVIGTQDGNLKQKNKWYVNKYDDYGRPIQNGFMNSQPSPNVVNVLDEVLSEHGYGTMGINIDKTVSSKFKVLGSTNTFMESGYAYNSLGQLVAVTGNSLINASTASIFTLLYKDKVGNVYESNTSAHGWNFNSSIFYDGQGRTKTATLDVTSSLASVSSQLFEMKYNHRNEVVTVFQGKTAFTDFRQFLQKIDYTYKVNGLLESVNQPLTASVTSLTACNNPVQIGETIDTYDKKDLFYAKYQYDQVLAGQTNATRKNGEVSSEVWQIKGRAQEAYSHTYDQSGRLMGSNHHQQSGSLFFGTGRYDQSQSYDVRGNIKNLRRTGFNGGDCNVLATIDSLTYSYDGNQLMNILDQAPCPTNLTLPEKIEIDQTYQASQVITIDSTVVAAGAQLSLSAGQQITILRRLDIKSNQGASVQADSVGCSGSTYFTSGFNQTTIAGQYTYDANGNLTHDPYKKLDLSYNHLNLIDTIKNQNGDKIIFTYDASGSLQRKTVVRNDTIVESRTFVGSAEWLGDTLALINHSQGQFVRTGSVFEKHYFMMDQLGNTRVVYQDKNEDGIIQAATEVMQENHYYPFGMKQMGRKFGNEKTNEYFYNGIRREDALGVDFDMAFYRSMDATIGRWHQQDPRMESMADYSPYTAMNDNPVSVADPNGDIGQFLGSALTNFLFQAIFNYSGFGGFGLSPTTDITGSAGVGDFDRIGRQTQIAWDDWYTNAAGEVVFDPRVSSQNDIDALGLGGTYLGKKGFGIDELTGLGISYNEDGSRFLSAIWLDEMEISGNLNKSSQFISAVSDIFSGGSVSRASHALDVRAKDGHMAYLWESVGNAHREEFMMFGGRWAGRTSGGLPKNNSKYWLQGADKSTLNTTIKGRYAVQSISGDATRNFNTIRSELNSIGQKYGCHTCGSKTPNGVYIPDHQPSIKLDPNGPYELFPHCISCSRLQGGQVNKILNHK